MFLVKTILPMRHLEASSARSIPPKSLVGFTLLRKLFGKLELVSLKCSPVDKANKSFKPRSAAPTLFFPSALLSNLCG